MPRSEPSSAIEKPSCSWWRRPARLVTANSSAVGSRPCWSATVRSRRPSSPCGPPSWVSSSGRSWPASARVGSRRSPPQVRDWRAWAAAQARDRQPGGDLALDREPAVRGRCADRARRANPGRQCAVGTVGPGRGCQAVVTGLLERGMGGGGRAPRTGPEVARGHRGTRPAPEADRRRSSGGRQPPRTVTDEVRQAFLAAAPGSAARTGLLGWVRPGLQAAIASWPPRPNGPARRISKPGRPLG